MTTIDQAAALRRNQLTCAAIDAVVKPGPGLKAELAWRGSHVRKIVTAAIVVAFAAVGFASGGIAANRKVDVINKTGMQLKHFYASNTGTNGWEEDILGRDVLDDGETFEADIDDGTGACKFDFKGVFVSNQEVIKRNVDVCQISTFTFTR